MTIGEDRRRRPSVVVRELRWFALAFGVPFVAIVAIDLVSSQSPLPLWRRITTLEDTCTYGMCLVLPAMSYLVAVMVRVLRR